MVHLKPLPSAPGYQGSLEEILRLAQDDLKALEQGGANAFIVENFGDIPYDDHVELIGLTSFVAIATRLRQMTNLPMGVNLQFNDVDAEWAAAYAAGADFIRVEAFAETRVGPNGFFKACGPHLMRLKQAYPKDIALLCDVDVKHTFPLVSQPLEFTIEAIQEGGGDAIISTGLVTGKSPSLDDVRTAKRAAGDFPVIVGSGVKAATAKDYLSVADGAIVGSSFKKDGNVMNPIDEKRVAEFMSALGR
jgi:membrane complex biogenesis BtpA family protein